MNRCINVTKTMNGRRSWTSDWTKLTLFTVLYSLKGQLIRSYRFDDQWPSVQLQPDMTRDATSSSSSDRISSHRQTETDRRWDTLAAAPRLSRPIIPHPPALSSSGNPPGSYFSPDSAALPPVLSSSSSSRKGDDWWIFGMGKSADQISLLFLFYESCSTPPPPTKQGWH